MKNLTAFFYCACALWCAESTAREITVSPDGLSPREALLKVREAKTAGDTGAFTIRVRPGRYVLPEPLVFTPADSGTPENPVRWIGESGKTVFAGGVRIANWREDAPGIWSAAIPKAADGKNAYFEQLWVNGRRAARSRLPNEGYFKIASSACTEETGCDPKNFIERVTFSDPAAAALLGTPKAEIPFAQMGLIAKWTFARRILRGVAKTADGVEAVTHAPVYWPNFSPWNTRDVLIFFENVRPGFDAPGEWFYDANAGRVLYRPLPNEKMAEADVFAPTSDLARLVEIKGEPDEGRYVSDIRFENITFEGTHARTIPTEVVLDETKGAYVPPTAGPTESWQYQAAQSSDGAIDVEGARRISWYRCAVRHTANYAFRFNDGCTSNEVVDCTLEDLGAGGVWMGARKGYVAPSEGTVIARRAYHDLAPRSTAFNLVSNCVIRGGGRFNPEATGVAITHASDCRVVHCNIHDFFYTGVSVGWVWGFRGSVAQRNEVAYNRIWDLGKGYLSDMGGVYTLGTSYGTHVHHNVIHDVKSYLYGGWGLYTDEGSEGILMERNLCWNTTDGSFHQHFGTGCVIRNNIFAFNLSNPAVRMYRREVQNIPCTLNFICNIVLVDVTPFAGSDVLGVGGIWANNLWYDVSGEPSFADGDWKHWQSTGKELNGRYADPQFVDAAHFDFRLKETSPAFDLGFEAWDYSTAGARLP